MLPCGGRPLASRAARARLPPRRLHQLVIGAMGGPTPLWSEERKPLVVVGSVNAGGAPWVAAPSRSPARLHSTCSDQTVLLGPALPHRPGLRGGPAPRAGRDAGRGLPQRVPRRQGAPRRVPACAAAARMVLQGGQWRRRRRLRCCRALVHHPAFHAHAHAAAGVATRPCKGSQRVPLVPRLPRR